MTSEEITRQIKAQRFYEEPPGSIHANDRPEIRE